MTPKEILEGRLTKEAERNSESVEATCERMITLGLDAAQERRASEAQQRGLSADVLLVTATRTEHAELKEAARWSGLPFERRKGRFSEYHHLGVVGTNRVAALRVGMGAFGVEGTASRCLRARIETQATMLILLGTAYGIDSERQRIGDVLVSEAVLLYDDRAVVDADARVFASHLQAVAGLVDRVSGSRWSATQRTRRLARPSYEIGYPDRARRPASEAWVSRLRRVEEEFALNGETVRVTVGTLLSGGALIESARFRDELVAGLPVTDSPVIGGEMEAMGVISAANIEPSDDPGWVVVKGIADFAEGESRAKIEKNRGPAARAAARVVLRALQSASFPMRASE